MSDLPLYDYLNAKFGPDPNLTPRDGTTDATVIRRIRKHGELLHGDKWKSDVKRDNGNHAHPDKLILTPDGGYIHTEIQRAWESAPSDIDYLLSENARLASALAAVTAERDELTTRLGVADDTGQSLTIVTTGASLSHRDDTLTIEMSEDDWVRLADFGVRASGMVVTLVKP